MNSPIEASLELAPGRLPGLRPHHDCDGPQAADSRAATSAATSITATQHHDRSAEGATHAWVEALLPGLGWVGFDPTNDLMAGSRHIRTAVGRDYADVPPTLGTMKGRAETELQVRVRVDPVTDPAAARRGVRRRRGVVAVPRGRPGGAAGVRPAAVAQGQAGADPRMR